MKYRYQWDGQTYEITLERHENGFRVVIGEQSYAVEVLEAQPGQLSLRMEGRPVTLYWAADGDRKWVSLDGCAYLLEKPARPRTRRPGETAAEDEVRAPMPAQVRALLASEGDRVEKGQTLLLLEAMKMEIRVRAPRAGQVKKLHLQEGEQVDRGQVLLEIGDPA